MISIAFCIAFIDTAPLTSGVSYYSIEVEDVPRGPNELHTVGTVGNSMATDASVRFGDGLAGRVAETREPLLIRGLVGPPPCSRPRRWAASRSCWWI